MAIGLAMALRMSTAILAANFNAYRPGRILGLFACAIAVGRMTGPTLANPARRLAVDLRDESHYWFCCKREPCLIFFAALENDTPNDSMSGAL